jgi:D-glycero-alpha-D-manno-heptose-7-phosphate kinase
LGSQNKGASLNQEKVVQGMHQIKKIGLEIKEAFEKEDLETFGKLLDQHWQTKKTLSDKMTQDKIDHWYEIAKKNGALGGKLMGAGGGGFFMFYCNNGKNGFRKIMEQEELKEMRFRLDFDGSKVLVNI